MLEYNSDILENEILALSPELLSLLLKDHSTQGNIFWATDNYADRGEGYRFFDPITIESITGNNGNVIVPRSLKPRQQQQQRSREMAEVFTPSWICNKQNNLIDNAWFGRENVFNTEVDNIDGSHSWLPTEDKVEFPQGKTWKDYISENRLEITCGEAPYLVSRYDTVTGYSLAINQRIGMLDRKLRIVTENTETSDKWIEASIAALRSIYGYEWQGDSLILARENILYTMLDYFRAKFEMDFPKRYLLELADVISWNVWQMDGLKGVVPCSCHEDKIIQYSFDGKEDFKVKPCPGCKNKDIKLHNGVLCNIMDWDIGQPIKFISLISNGNQNNYGI